MPNDRMIYRMVRRDRQRGPLTLSDEQRAVVDHDRGRMKVVAGPGTGKTATVVEAVADRVVRRGVDPASILVLTFSRRAADELAQRVATRLGMAAGEPVVRTIHSYAYALLRDAAAAQRRPPPRLLDAAQTNEMVRDLLAGHVADGGMYWPETLRPALSVPAFAAELREVVLRLAERRVAPAAVAELGRRRGRPEWEALARFMTEYRNVADLSTGTGRRGAVLDQAELTTAALALLDDPVVLAREHHRIHCLIVDEYQDVDPAQDTLIDRLAGGADEFIAVGDPDQSIYAFRGALPGAFEDLVVDEQCALTVSYRLPPAMVRAGARIAAGIPRRTRRPEMRSAGTVAPGDVRARVLPRRADEAAWIADEFRRAHLHEEIPWSQMAVLARSPAEVVDDLTRAFDAAGIPVDAGAARPCTDHPLVAALVSVLRVASAKGSVDPSVTMSLMTSPLGRIDPMMMRRARRAIRSLSHGGDVSHIASSHEVLRDIVVGDRPMPPGLPKDAADRLGRVSGLVDMARDRIENRSAEEVLWRVWQQSGCVDELMRVSEQGGRDSHRADAALDAVIDLFDRAAGVVGDAGPPSVTEFLTSLRDDAIPVVPRRTRDNAVAIRSAHAAKGLEWSVVAVCRVQDETWPDLRPRATLLEASELLDLAMGVPVSRPESARLADERRLFYVSLTRASRRLLISAVDDHDTAPSRWVSDAAGCDPVPQGWPRSEQGADRRAMTLPSLVASMRAAVATHDSADSRAGNSATSGDRAQQRRAAVGLARLARSGVTAADPKTWYGLAPVSTDAPLVPPERSVRLSPSTAQSASECPLRTTLERQGGRSDKQGAQMLGIAVHALAEGIAAGATTAQVDTAIEEFITAQQDLPQWQAAQLRRRMQSMRRALVTWLEQDAAGRTFIGSEVAVDVALPGDGRPARLTGRIDWVAADDTGRPVVTDFKTGATKPSISQMPDYPQLAAYQLAVSLGALAGHSGTADADSPGGAELVFLAGGTPTVRTQPGFGERDQQRWLSAFHALADDLAGASFVARQGAHCGRCPVRASCPLWPEGRQVSQS